MVVLYPPGGYGTFVEWSIVYLTGAIPSNERPFTSTGSAHNYTGHGYDLQTSTPVSVYFESDEEYPLIRTHGSITPEFSFQDFVNKYGPQVTHIISMQPSVETTLMLVYNLMTKTVANTLKQQIYSKCNKNDPPWQVRENISFWLEGRCPGYHDWCTATGPNVIPVLIKDFVQDPKTVLLAVMKQTGFAVDANRAENFNSIVDEWRALQKFLDVDSTVLKIVNNTAADIDYDWSLENLSVIDEAFAQMLLRSLHGLAIRCYNLNVFPTNTQDLRKLLINV